MKLFAFIVVTCALAAGCSPAPKTAPPAAVKMAAQPMPILPGRRVSTLLNFDSPPDVTFIAAEPDQSIAADSSVARSGSTSLALRPGVRSIVVKVPTLMEGRPFPADWTLLGAYLHSDVPIYVAVTYEIANRVVLTRTVGLGAGQWTPVMLDLAPLGTSSTGELGELRLSFNTTVAATVHVDDVMLVDNHETIVDTSKSTSGWSVKRRGLYYVIDAPGRFSFRVPTSQAERSGWNVADSCSTRVRFTSTGRPSAMTVYSDGRLFWGGEFRAVAPTMRDASDLSRQHSTPAELSVSESFGRLNRATAGDQDNDGYNESRGAYQIIAAGPRVELTVSPRTSVLSRPVLEIAGLPAGVLLVNMEGRLVPGAVRLSNGDVLVELPARLQRPTLVNVRVQ
jgi:hypothetical protein